MKLKSQKQKMVLGVCCLYTHRKMLLIPENVRFIQIQVHVIITKRNLFILIYSFEASKIDIKSMNL